MEDIDFEELIESLRDGFLEQTRYTLAAWIYDYLGVNEYTSGDHYDLIHKILTVVSELDPELFDKISDYTKTSGLE